MPSLRNRVDFKLVAYVLFGASAIVLAGAVLLAVKLMPTQKGEGGQEPSSEAVRELAALAGQSVEPFQTYSQAFQGHELFKSVETRPAQVQTGPGIEQLAQHLAFTGVVQLDQLEAIINDRRTRQTFFVRVGSSIGDLKVDEITESRVVLSHGSDRKELYLQ